MTGPAIPKAVLFDLLTALLDSALLWNAVAGSDEKGRAWRAEYLRLTYGCGAYRPYEQLVREAADATAIEDSATEALVSRWGELSPWSGAQTLLDNLQNVTKLAVVTNCWSVLAFSPPRGWERAGTASLRQSARDTTNRTRVRICSRSKHLGRRRGMPCSSRALDMI
jgi:hypothetical protein